VQRREHHFNGGAFFYRVLIDGDASPVITHFDCAVAENANVDSTAVPGERFVDGVVDNFVHQVVKPAGSGGSDVHAGTLTDRFEAFENLNVTRAVRGFFLATFRLWRHMSVISYGVQETKCQPLQISRARRLPV